MRITPYITPAQVFAALLAVVLVHGCKQGSAPPDSAPPVSPSAQTSATSADTATPTAIAEATATPEQKELAKPAAGKGNVQGKVLFNDKPATNIEVALSEKFSPFGGASGKSYTARTNKNGDYVIKNVPPKEYEGLTARVFDTSTVIFIKSGFIEAKKYTVEAGKTLFVDPTNLFKSDLKILAPKASGTLPVKQAVFKWQAYRSAAYYKISLYADDYKVNPGVFDERVDGTTYQPDKPLRAGSYRVEVEAFNGSDHKLAQGPEQYKFRVTS